MSWRASRGLLIVNADDWGLSSRATDAILACFRSGAVTSTTAMVYMRDSERAAALALEEGIPTGLHLNLIEPFTAPDVPPEIAERQRRVCGRMWPERAGALLYDPRWKRDFDRCIADQLDRFRQLYVRAPTHVDGHRHQHLALNVVASPAIRDIQRYRRPFSLAAGESPLATRVARRLLTGAIRMRFETADYLYSIRTLVPELGGRDLDRKLLLARDRSVEVMVHPELTDEMRVLQSDDWRTAIAPYVTGSFADLTAD